MNLRIALLITLAFLLSGCKTQSAMTAQSTGCRTLNIDIVKSRYANEGSTTVWCAKCKDKLYLCVSNPDHSRVECKETAPDLCQ
jgi:hypothetical protein